MPNLKKTVKRERNMTTKEIIAEIKEIIKAIRNENISYGEIAFISQPHVQEIIKKYFPDEIDLWQWAEINQNNSWLGESAKKSKVRTMAESVLTEMITVKMDENAALDMLMTRLEHWTTTPQIRDLYEKMYWNYIEGGVFDGGEFDPAIIVDNDWINYCNVVEKGEENFDKLLAVYKEQGLGDISTEHVDGISYIEAVDDEEEPEMFLIRY